MNVKRADAEVCTGNTSRLKKKQQKERKQKSLSGVGPMIYGSQIQFMETGE